MFITIKSIRLHNFMSYEDSTIVLNQNGYIIVSGINNNKDDNAMSNGAGKSTCFEALVWAITGDTIRGTSDVKRFNAKDKCEVELDFSIDTDDYKIIRTKDPSNLFIYVNGENISGKGIRDTSQILKERLPDLTAQLIGSVIILGQGLPMRFSNNTPSGRKEVLEKLSKSDFMITDLKDRISNRLLELKTNIRQHEDNLLKLNTQKQLAEDALKENTIKLENLKSDDFLKEQINQLEGTVLDKQIKISSLQDEIDSKSAEYEKLLVEYKTYEAEITKNVNEIKAKWTNEINSLNSVFTNNKNDLSTEKLTRLSKIDSDSSELISELKSNLTRIETEAKTLKKQINDIKNIKDVCLTCGQKLPDVNKPDPTLYIEQLNDKEVEIESIKTELNNNINKVNATKQEVDKEIIEKIQGLEKQYKVDLKSFEDAEKAELLEYEAKSITRYNELKNEVDSKNIDILNNKQRLEELIKSKDDYIELLNKTKIELELLAANKQTINNAISEAQQNIKTYNLSLDKITDLKAEVEEHLAIVNKMNTSINRDFRGILLNNIIKYIDLRAKEYSQIVFGTNKIDFKLDGNNILIAYCDKDYTNLSGGEKQRVDLIVQFALRDMLCKYLNFSSNILVLDEIVDNLDNIGCQKVMELISTKLNDVESIYIISHHADISMPYDHEITIIKDENGISYAK